MRPAPSHIYTVSGVPREDEILPGEDCRAGGISILRDYVWPKRALRPNRVTVRFESEPGRQPQADWGEQRTVIAGAGVTVPRPANADRNAPPGVEVFEEAKLV
jgi:hypothetical protein